MREHDELHKTLNGRKLNPDELMELAKAGPDACVRAHAAIILDDKKLFKQALADHHADKNNSGFWYGIQSIRDAEVNFRIAKAFRKGDYWRLAIERAAWRATLAQALEWSQDRDPSTRGQILSKAGSSFRANKSQQAVWTKALIAAALNDPNRDVRCDAVYPMEGAIELNEVLSRSHDPAVRTIATKKSLGQRRLVELALSDRHSAVRVSALEVLKPDCPDPEELEGLTKDKDDVVAAAAARCLKRGDAIARAIAAPNTNRAAKNILKRLPGWRVLAIDTGRDVSFCLVPPSETELVDVVRGFRGGLGGQSIRGKTTGVHVELSFAAASDKLARANFKWLQSGMSVATVDLPDGKDAYRWDDEAPDLGWTATIWAGGTILATIVPDREHWSTSHNWHGDSEFDFADSWDGSYHHPEGSLSRLIIRSVKINVFASYARDDLEIVKFATSFGRTLPMYRLNYDLEILRSGDDWDAKIQEAIRKAHVFQLFWSKSAAVSPSVEREWRYALSLKRRGFVCPVHWQSRTLQPSPPPELAAINFQRIEVPKSVLQAVRPK